MTSFHHCLLLDYYRPLLLRVGITGRENNFEERTNRTFNLNSVKHLEEHFVNETIVR